MEKKYVIFLNGEYKYSQEFMDKLVSENAVCFCADGGANFAFKYGKIPEMIVGDLDSIEKKVLEYYKSKNILIKKFPKDKDFTDFELILKEINKISENKNFIEKIFVVGGLGSSSVPCRVRNRTLDLEPLVAGSKPALLSYDNHKRLLTLPSVPRVGENHWPPRKSKERGGWLLQRGRK